MVLCKHQKIYFLIGVERQGDKVVLPTGGIIGTYEKKIWNKDPNSRFHESTVSYVYKVVPKSTKPANKNNSNNTSSNNNYNNKPTDTKMTLNANVTSPGGWAQSKNITITLSGSNVTLNHAAIYVDGKKVANKNGQATYKATKNKTYKIKVKYLGLDDIVFDYKVNKIDTEKPSYKYISQMVTGSNVNHLTITAKDNGCLKKISVNDKAIYTYDKKTGYYVKNVRYDVKTSGKYTIKIEDLAGNVYQKTENIIVDTKAPEVKSVQIKKNSKSGYEESRCPVKKGDNVSIVIKTNENVVSYGAIEINNVVYKTGKVSTGGTNTFTVSIDITDKFGQGTWYGDLDVEIYGISDKYGNSTNYMIKDNLYFDNEAPEFNKIEITGGKLSSDRQRVEIYEKSKITVEMTIDEKLVTDPNVTIGKTSTLAKLKNTIQEDGIIQYLYEANINTDDLIPELKEQNLYNTCIPVIITNYQDNAGNVGESITIKEENKSTNGVYLFYGKNKIGEVCFAQDLKVVNETSIVLGDLNADGLITEYDISYLQRALAGKETLTELQKSRADIDGDKNISITDVPPLQKLIKSTANEVSIGKTIKIKAYNEDLEQLTGEDLNVTIVEGSDYVTTSDDGTIPINDGVITIKVKDSATAAKSIITIKASYSKEGSSEEQVGQISFAINKQISDNAGIEVISESKTNRDIVGDLNQDGFVTRADGIIIQRIIAQLAVPSNIRKDLGDILNDGELNLLDTNTIDKMIRNTFNGMKKGDSLTLKVRSNYYEEYEELKDNTISEQVTWFTNDNTNALTITPNETDGTANVKVNDNAEKGTKVIIYCKIKIRVSDEEIEEQVARFNVEVLDNASVELDKDIIKYDLSKLPEKNTILSATTNLSNRAFEWKSSDENIVKLAVDSFGNAEVIPVKEGNATIQVKVDETIAECQVKVERSIVNITSSKTNITLKETQQENTEILTNQNMITRLRTNMQLNNINSNKATEEPIVTSLDEDIAQVYLDKDTGEYKILGISEGSTTIQLESPTNADVKETIEVNVKPLKSPIIQSVSIDQAEGEQNYKVGDKINIKIGFSDVITGEVPSLNLKFGLYDSVGNTEFVSFEDNSTAIVYQYCIQEGDNGVLQIKSLTEGNLTDDTTKMEGILAVSSEIEQYDEEIIVDETEGLTQEDSNINEQNLVAVASIEDNEELENAEVIPNGIYKDISEVIADTTAAEIIVTPEIDKNAYYLTKGDVVKVNITSNEELAEKPTVTMGGLEAVVEGSGKEFTAQIDVTKELKEGYLEIKVSGCKDLAGNTTEVICNEENMDEPIIIDYSSPKVKEIKILNEDGKVYKSGDKVEFVVLFEDGTMKDRTEYVGCSKAPDISIRCGENKAQGKLESDYQVGEYVDYIIYTYTISEQDYGKFEIIGLKGTIKDIAGNQANLNEMENISEITTGSINEIAKTLNLAPFKLPYAGTEIVWAVILIISASIITAGAIVIRKKVL